MKRLIGILSGGSGTRLWPLSRTTYPKQFQDLAGLGEPLIITTIKRLMPIGTPHIITGQPLFNTTMTSLYQNDFGQTAVITEPCGKNTAAAIALITRNTLREHGDAIIGIFPADHHITNGAAFEAAAQKAFALAQENNCLVTLGIKPTYAAIEYGYMELDAQSAVDTFHVKRFVEKPNLDTAKNFMAAGNFVWNAGMFIFPAQLMAEYFAKYLPEVWHPINDAQTPEELAAAYATIPSISIDYGIMEKLSDILCLVADIGWSDLGSWEAVVDARQNLECQIETSGSGNKFVSMHPTKKTAYVVGFDDAIIVDTPDAILIVKRGHGQELRTLTKKLEEQNNPLLHTHFKIDDLPPLA